MLRILHEQNALRERYCEIKSEKSSKVSIKSIGKSELAEEIYPNRATSTALKKLAHLLQNNPDLMAQLRQAGYRSGARNLTPRQADIIRKFVE